MLASEAFCSALMALSSSWEVTDVIFLGVEKFVCALYGRKDYGGVNVAWHNLFRLTFRPEALPLNQDSLKHHIARANYQIAMHSRCLERFIDALSAVGQVEDEQLVYKWMENSPAPQSVLKSINCKCKKNCCKGVCSFLKWGLPS